MEQSKLLDADSFLSWSGKLSFLSLEPEEPYENSTGSCPELLKSKWPDMNEEIALSKMLTVN
jgi:hypothetical protein